jgi:hypothetical protein
MGERLRIECEGMRVRYGRKGEEDDIGEKYE